MNDNEFDPGSEEIIGIVDDEHYKPDDPEQIEGTVAAKRIEYTDRTFYTLQVSEGSHAISIDLDRTGWSELRTLCDLMLTRIDTDTAEG